MIYEIGFRKTITSLQLVRVEADDEADLERFKTEFADEHSFDATLLDGDVTEIEVEIDFTNVAEADEAPTHTLDGAWIEATAEVGATDG